ncbi:MAG: phospholipase D-like domain-containing protein [Ignavibacteria bacterium]
MKHRAFTQPLLYVLLGLWTAVAFSQEPIELVESVPLETNFEQSKIKKTSEVWVEMFNLAKSSIEIETFYFSHKEGESLTDILNALISAAARGVKIRIIVDRKFYLENGRGVDYLNEIKNVEIRKIDFAQLAGGVMHTKYFVVDSSDVFLGSQNMDWRALIHIHELGIRIKNKKLAENFLRIFEIDWILSKYPEFTEFAGIRKSKIKNVINSRNKLKIHSEKYGLVKLYPCFSPPLLIPKVYSWEETELLKLINKASKKLYIQIYSYSIAADKENYEKIDKALKRAANRGVDIKIIVPDWVTDRKYFGDIKELSKTKGIEIKISSIPIFSGGFIPYARVEHCKYLLADENISWISTSNWEKSYFYNSRNASIVIQNDKINSELTELFLKDWNGKYTEYVCTDRDYPQIKRK